SINQSGRSTQSLHDCEIAAAVENPSCQGRQQAERSSQNNQDRRGQERRPHLTEDPRFTFYDLPHGTDFRLRTRTLQFLNRANDLLRGAGRSDFDGRRLKASPRFEIGEREIDAVIFRGTGLQHTSGSEMDCAPPETEIECLSLRRHDLRCTDAHKRGLCFGARLRPCCYRPPIIQLANFVEIRAGDHDRAALRSARNYISEWDSEAAIRDRGVYDPQRISGKRLSFSRHHDYVCAVLAELFPQFSLSIHIQIDYGGGDARSYYHGEQRGRGTAAAQYSSADQHPQKHRSVRSGSTALFCQLRVHASPRNAYTGSNFTARRIANVLPANVTPIAMARIIGSSTVSIVIREAKMERPIFLTIRPPPRNPT